MVYHNAPPEGLGEDGHEVPQACRLSEPSRTLELTSHTPLGCLSVCKKCPLVLRNNWLSML
jgi:hypothetical protein